MALNPNDLKNDILADTAITSPIPGVSAAQFEIFISRLSIHITNQIKRGKIDDVTVELTHGKQINVSNIQ